VTIYKYNFIYGVHYLLDISVKVKSDYEFCRLIEDLQNSVGDKSTSSVDVEASQPDNFVRYKSTEQHRQ